MIQELCLILNGIDSEVEGTFDAAVVHNKIYITTRLALAAALWNS